MTKIINFFKNNWIITVTVISGLLLRLWNLTGISLWHDEAFSALLIKYNWSEMMYRIGLDVHPPMYYIFLRIWTEIFGHSLFALRGMSVFFGVGTILTTYFFVNYVFNNKKAALIAAILVAVNPFQVQYVTEARMYTMGGFFAVSAALALVAALRNQTAYYVNAGNEFLQKQLHKQFITYYALFVLCSAILIYTHYYLLFTVAALGAYAVLYCIIKYKTEFKKYVWVVLSGFAILASFLPWLKVFIFQFKQVGAGYWIPPMDRWSIPSTLWDLLLQLSAPGSKTILFQLSYQHLFYILLTAFVLITIIHLIRNSQQIEKWLVLAVFLAPFGGSILFLIIAKLQGNNSSVYLVRYFIFCSSFYLILISSFLTNFKIKDIGKMLVILLVVLNIYSIWNYWNELQVQTKPGMSDAVKFLKANVEPKHKIFVGSSFEFFNFKYYNNTGVKPQLFTDGHHVHDLPHFAGTAILTEDDLVLNFSDSTRHGDTIWLIWTNGFGGTKPTIPSSWELVDEKSYNEVRPYVGTVVYVDEYQVK